MTNEEVRRWTNAALDVMRVLRRAQECGLSVRVLPLPLFVIERIHAQACEEGEKPFSIQADLLASLLAMLLRDHIRCANGADHDPPVVPAEWNCEDPVFCPDCCDSASREMDP